MNQVTKAFKTVRREEQRANAVRRPKTNGQPSQGSGSNAHEKNRLWPVFAQDNLRFFALSGQETQPFDDLGDARIRESPGVFRADLHAGTTENARFCDHTRCFADGDRVGRAYGGAGSARRAALLLRKGARLRKVGILPVGPAPRPFRRADLSEAPDALQITADRRPELPGAADIRRVRTSFRQRNGFGGKRMFSDERASGNGYEAGRLREINEFQRGFLL